ncbi:homeobox-leucine zipper protein HDG11 [Trifolium repens]|nr:homeobox-leucine zipper protein HDG11 [Trifolium repens]
MYRHCSYPNNVHAVRLGGDAVLDSTIVQQWQQNKLKEATEQASKNIVEKSVQDVITHAPEKSVQDVITRTPQNVLAYEDILFGDEDFSDSLNEEDITKTMAEFARDLPNVDTSNSATAERNPIEGKRIVMKLGERLLKIFHDALNNMSSNKDFPELNTLDRDGVSVNVRKCRDPGTENGATLTAKSSFWLSCSPEYAFNFLKDNSTRFQWDIICEGHHPVEELYRITHGTNPGNITSIIRTLNPEDENFRILQQCYTRGMESGLVYCTIDTETINCAIRGEDCSMLPLLPSGFTISGGGRSSHYNKGEEAGGWSGGSVVTVAYQLLIGKPAEIDNPNLDAVKKVNKLVTSTVNNIKHALKCLDY